MSIDPHSPPRDRRSSAGRWPTLVWLVALCAASWLHQSWYDFVHDDAYISYRYAENWAAGRGPVYNAGERVEGYTNFLHVAVLAGAARGGLDIERTARASGTVAAFGLVLVAAALVARGLQRGRVAALVTAAAVAVHAGIAVWARSGLETLPFALVVLAAQARFVDERRLGRAHWMSGVLFAIAALARADGVVFAAATALYLLLRRAGVRRFATLVVPVAVVVVAHVAWRWSYYGDLLPNTYYVKVAGGGIVQQVRGLFYAYNFVLPFGGMLLFALPLVLFACRDRDRDDARAYLGFSVAVAAASIVWVGGDHMPMARFFVPVVAALQVLFVEAAIEIVALWRGRTPRAARAVQVALYACIVSAGLLPTLNARRLPASFAKSNAALTRQWALAGRWLGAHLPPATVLATEPAGAVAYYSRLPVIDMLGLNDRHIARVEPAGMGRGSAGHEKRDLAYVLSRRPDVFFRGVHTDCDGAGRVRVFEDGSHYRMRCELLGPGPLGDDFGSVREVELFVWFEERIGGAAPPP